MVNFPMEDSSIATKLSITPFVLDLNKDTELTSLFREAGFRLATDKLHTVQGRFTGTTAIVRVVLEKACGNDAMALTQEAVLKRGETHVEVDLVEPLKIAQVGLPDGMISCTLHVDRFDDGELIAQVQLIEGQILD